MNRPTHVINIVDGVMDRLAIRREGGNNWCATITPDTDKPGGCDRKFWRNSNVLSGSFVVPDDVKLYDALEVAADERGRGRDDWKKDRLRAFYVIVARCETQIVFEEYRSAKAAMNAAARYREGTGENKHVMFFSTAAVEELVINAGISENGWQLSTGEIIAQPPERMICAGVMWNLVEAIPGKWRYAKQGEPNDSGKSEGGVPEGQ